MLPIVFENNDLIACNKPHGLPSGGLPKNPHAHSASESMRPYVFHEPAYEPGLLHRLDTATSGILLFAKHKQSYEAYRSNWHTWVRKIYCARIHTMHTLPREITYPLGHSRKNQKKMCALVHERDQNRMRHAKIQAARTLIMQHENDLEIEITTGVRHQIRCHLAAVDAPILGDTLYGGAPSSRLHLHAWKLILLHEGLTITTEIPF